MYFRMASEAKLANVESETNTNQAPELQAMLPEGQVTHAVSISPQSSAESIVVELEQEGQEEQDEHERNVVCEVVCCPQVI